MGTNRYSQSVSWSLEKIESLVTSMCPFVIDVEAWFEVDILMVNVTVTKSMQGIGPRVEKILQRALPDHVKNIVVRERVK